MEEEQAYFPLYVNLKNRKILVVGGGSTAERRILSLLDFGGSITVEAPGVTPGIAGLAGEGRLAWRCREYKETSLEGMELVLAATDRPEVNRAVYEACKKRHIPVNCADDKELCDFYFPALVQGAGLVIGVSSSGKDHAKVRRIAEKLRRWLEGQQ